MALNPRTVALEVRSARLPRFRRCGMDFALDPLRIEVARLSPVQVETLLASDPRRELVVSEVLAPPAPSAPEAVPFEASTEVTTKAKPRKGKR